MHLKIITHENIVFDEDVDEIYSKALNGEFGVLKDHIPFMNTLDIAVTKPCWAKQTDWNNAAIAIKYNFIITFIRIDYWVKQKLISFNASTAILKSIVLHAKRLVTKYK